MCVTFRDMDQTQDQVIVGNVWLQLGTVWETADIWVTVCRFSVWQVVGVVLQSTMARSSQ